MTGVQTCALPILAKLYKDHENTRNKLAALDDKIAETKSALVKTIGMVEHRASIMFIHPNGTRWVCAKTKNSYSERHVYAHDGKRRGEKVIDSTRMSNYRIRLDLAVTGGKL